MAKNTIIIQNARFDWRGDQFEYARVALSFEANGARYHMWLNRNTGEAEDGPGTWLYKNPPQIARGVRYAMHKHTGEYFETRKLDSAAKVNAELIARARDAAATFERDAAGAFLYSRVMHKRQCREAQAKRDAELNAAQAVGRVKEHGPELLDALKIALSVMNATAHDSLYDKAKAIAYVAIAAAEKGSV
jgi:hypothetical protein